jgi:2,3-dihydroxybenzoate decarboxylase
MNYCLSSGRRFFAFTPDIDIKRMLNSKWSGVMTEVIDWSEKSCRRIPTEEAFAVPEQFDAMRTTEEAFAVPEQFDAMRKVVAETSVYHPDLYLWSRTLAGGVIHDRLLDLDGERIEIMDQAGIDTALLSLTSTGVQMLGADTATAVAAVANDRLADAITRHPGRYAGLATVAPQDPARAANEVERAIKKLKLNGIIINSHTNGEFLSEEKYWPILQAIEAVKAPLYIHPRCPGPLHAAAYREDHLEFATWGYAAETGLHALRLITGGIFDRFPGLRVVLGHMGEGIPYWFYRIDNRYETEYFRDHFTITTSGVNWDPPLELCVSVLGAENVMFAVDYPYQETFEAVDWMNAAPLSDEDKKLVTSIRRGQETRLQRKCRTDLRYLESASVLPG